MTPSVVTLSVYLDNDQTVTFRLSDTEGNDYPLGSATVDLIVYSGASAIYTETLTPTIYDTYVALPWLVDKRLTRKFYSYYRDLAYRFDIIDGDTTRTFLTGAIKVLTHPSGGVGSTSVAAVVNDADLIVSAMVGDTEGDAAQTLADRVAAAASATAAAASAAEAAEDAAEVAAAADAVSLANTSKQAIPTFADIATSSFVASVDSLTVLGWASEGDLPPLDYRRAASDPGHSGATQDDDNVWWEAVSGQTTLPSVAAFTAAVALGWTPAPNHIVKLPDREYIWLYGDYSAQVAADPDEDVYVPPVADGTGASGTWARRFVSQGFVRMNGRERIRSLEDKFGPVIDVLDFVGIDPTGTNSSRDAIQSAITEMRAYSVAGQTTTANLYFPPNYVNGGEYVIDSSVNLTALRGSRNVIFSDGAVFRGVGDGLIMFDTFHSNSIMWIGGTFIGDETEVPLIGLQIGRRYTDTPLDNPSSHHHSLREMAFTGYWERCCLYNYASEELHAIDCSFRNSNPGPGTYAVVQDGQSGVWTPTSSFVPAGFGAWTGFANDVFDKCSFWKVTTDGDDISGSPVFLSRVEGHEFRQCLFQSRGSPHIEIHHVNGQRGTFGLKVGTRMETGDATAIINFTGDDGGVHRGIEVYLDRWMAQRLFEADSALSDGGVSLIDTKVYVANLFPDAASLNPNGYAEVFANRAKFGLVTGDICLSHRGTTETTTVAMQGLGLSDFKGRIKVYDRTAVGTLPTGDYVIEDEAGGPAAEVSTFDTTASFALQDSSGNSSPTTGTARYWRRGNRMHMVVRDLGPIDITGMVSSDIARFVLPVANLNSGYLGRIIPRGLASVPSGGAGTMDQIYARVGNSSALATARLVDATGSFSDLTVAAFSGGYVDEFYFEWNVA